MKRLGPFAAFVVVALVAHLAVVLAAPRVLMAIAVSRLEGLVGGVNVFGHLPRVTPDARTVVRPSPDLAYSACVIDLSAGPVEVIVHREAAGAVVALYGADTDALWASGALTPPGAPANLAPIRLRIEPPGADPVAPGAFVAPGARALVLVRRLAPQGAPDAAIEIDRARDRCAPAMGASEKEKSG